MALISCPECGKEISDMVTACPHCGYPLTVEGDENIKKVGVSSITLKKITPKKKKVIIISIIIIILAVILTVLVFFAFKQKAYNSATSLLSEEKYQEAVIAFNDLGGYKDSKEQAIQAYGKNFEQTISLIHINNLISEVNCSMISTTWSRAIDNRYGDDFNVAIQKLLNSFKKDGSAETAKKAKDDIDARMITLQNPVEGYAEAHKQLVEMYGIYVQIYDQSTSPTGSLVTYNSTVKSLSSDFEKAHNKIVIAQPSIKDKVSEDKKNINPNDSI